MGGEGDRLLNCLSPTTRQVAVSGLTHLGKVKSARTNALIDFGSLSLGTFDEGLEQLFTTAGPMHHPDGQYSLLPKKVADTLALAPYLEDRIRARIVEEYRTVDDRDYHLEPEKYFAIHQCKNAQDQETEINVDVVRNVEAVLVALLPGYAIRRLLNQTGGASMVKLRADGVILWGNIPIMRIEVKKTASDALLEEGEEQLRMNMRSDAMLHQPEGYMFGLRVAGSSATLYCLSGAKGPVKGFDAKELWSGSVHKWDNAIEFVHTLNRVASVVKTWSKAEGPGLLPSMPKYGKIKGNAPGCTLFFGDSHVLKKTDLPDERKQKLEDCAVVETIYKLSGKGTLRNLARGTTRVLGNTFNETIELEFPLSSNKQFFLCSPDQKSKMGRDLCCAIEDMHVNGYAHCDIREANVLVRVEGGVGMDWTYSYGSVKYILCDFETARRVAKDGEQGDGVDGLVHKREGLKCYWSEDASVDAKEHDRGCLANLLRTIQLYGK